MKSSALARKWRLIHQDIRLTVYIEEVDILVALNINKLSVGSIRVNSTVEEHGREDRRDLGRSEVSPTVTSFCFSRESHSASISSRVRVYVTVDSVYESLY